MKELQEDPLLVGYSRPKSCAKEDQEKPSGYNHFSMARFVLCWTGLTTQRSSLTSE